MNRCIGCCKEEGKYKCPTCFQYYCSMNCCKKHKKSKCTSPGKIDTTKEDTTATTQEFFTADTVHKEKLKLLQYNKNLKKLLENPHLRTFLQEVDSADNPEEVIAKAMLEPIFVEFTDACIQIVEPPDEETKI